MNIKEAIEKSVNENCIATITTGDIFVFTSIVQNLTNESDWTDMGGDYPNQYDVWGVTKDGENFRLSVTEIEGRLTMEEAYEIGLDHGYEMGLESGSSDSGCDGWDGMLMNVDANSARVWFGWVGQDSDDEAKALLEEYCRGCQDGADIGAKQRKPTNY